MAISFADITGITASTSKFIKFTYFRE